MILSDTLNINVFFMEAVQVFLSFQWKRTPFMKEMDRILQFTNPESSTFKKGFLCTPDRFFFIRGYFSKLFSISHKSEDLLRQAWYII